MPKPIDLSHWNNMPTARIWECSYLFFGYDPRGESADFFAHTSWPRNSEIFKIASHNEIAVAALKEGELITTDRYGDPHYATISLPAYLAWAKIRGWDTPANLTGHLTKPITPPAPALLAAQSPEKKEVIVKPTKVIEPLKVPEKITLPWIWHNADYRFWGVVLGGFITVVFASFSAGAWVAQSAFINQLIERKANSPSPPAGIEITRTPPASSEKMKIESTPENPPADKTGKPAT